MNNLVLLGIVLFLVILLYKKIEVAKVNMIAFMIAIVYSSTFLLNSYLNTILELYGEVFKGMAISVIVIGLFLNINIIVREWNEDSFYKRGILYLIITTVMGALIVFTVSSFTKVGITVIPFTFTGGYFVVGAVIILILLFILRKEEIYGVKKMVSLMQKGMPFIVFISTSLLIEINGLSALSSIIIFFFSIVLVCFIQVFLVHSGFILIVKKENPIEYFLSISKALYYAFKSRSSGETSPILAKEVAKTINLSSSLVTHYSSKFVKVGMNACNGIYPAFIGVFGLNLYGKDLSSINMILIILSVIIASLALQNMPGVASVSAVLVLIALGLPLDSLFIVLGIDYIIDKIRTTTNIAAVGAAIKIL
ncbi:MAG: cation:dicarboxylase symporter family transporter [Clostridium sp.]